MSKSKFKNPVVKWIDHRLPVFSFMDHELNHYPTPKNLNYFWNFGSLAGITLVIGAAYTLWMYKRVMFGEIGCNCQVAVL